MGEHGSFSADDRALRATTKSLLADLDTFERMLEDGVFAADKIRMGLEQEMFLVDTHGCAAPRSVEVLEKLSDPRFTTELARYNLEANLPPVELDGAFLGKVESDLRALLSLAVDAAHENDAEVLLTGILPSLTTSDIDLANMTPQPRYRQLNDAIVRSRPDDTSLTVRGLDELRVTIDSVMLESANTSVQLHLQVDPEDFARSYNLAQLISAPLLAAATNSPVLFGRRLWQETRVAVFEGATDARHRAARDRGARARVTFGDRWVESSPLELFREDALRCPVLLALPDERIGEPLSALALHNGTVWRWNRACFGRANERWHLRIENRVLPAGPTIVDELANAALFYGLMLGAPSALPNPAVELRFEEAKANFMAAAQRGLRAQLAWFRGRSIGVRELLLDELLPIADDGLASVGVPSEVRDRHLGVVRGRVEAQRTGSWAILDTLEAGEEGESAIDAARRTVRSLVELSSADRPVHEWPRHTPAPNTFGGRPTVERVMSTDLYTVRPRDVVDLAAEIMRWRHVRHVPVETAEGEVVGVVDPRALIGFVASDHEGESPAVEDVMNRDVPFVDSGTHIREAMDVLLRRKADCVLVIRDGRLAGIVTERDLLRAASRLLEPTSGGGDDLPLE